MSGDDSVVNTTKIGSYVPVSQQVLLDDSRFDLWDVINNPLLRRPLTRRERFRAWRSDWKWHWRDKIASWIAGYDVTDY